MMMVRVKTMTSNVTLQFLDEMTNLPDELMGQQLRMKFGWKRSYVLARPELGVQIRFLSLLHDYSCANTGNCPLFAKQLIHEGEE